jgi:hypothetical protein
VKVKPLFQQLVAACEADRENRCSVMNSSLVRATALGVVVVPHPKILPPTS